ncbi:D-Ala-D-Ala carboxypeptidase [Catellatospora methionotrophica]|uniref:D-Ala-D-Ala carboxypeptidase n=1 Tax=Catellatospora methionotrophica TaxID=121620 RepID=A0A8J3LEF2_9ACTN|nr:serine hydrolase domain-containing protein [Catellatospora methionotrophica]GIG17144.1 D-Ala-D-Ala carboxypeptidase [Catellatospora methionotrophica]
MQRFGVGKVTISLVAMAAFTAACGNTMGEPATWVTPTPAVPAYAAQLERTLQTIVGDLHVPGAVVMITSPAKGDWAQTFGTAELDGNAPINVGDHFRIGSNTKTMTGTALLQLVQEGKIGLDDPVSKYRPEVPNGDNITIAQMLSMRSGLYNYSEDEQFNADLDSDPLRVWKPDELLAIAFAKPPYFAPGAGFHYSNTNLILAGLIVEQLTGHSLQDEFQQRIFGPLGLKQTLLPAATESDLPTPHPQGYMFGTNVSTLTDPALPPAEQAAVAAGTLQPRDVTVSNPSWAWAAGGAISTAPDLTRYATALVGGGLLDAKTQQIRLDSIQPIQTPAPIEVGYGLAIARFGPLYGHDGQLPGFNSFMAHDPVRKDTVIVLTTLTAAADGRQPANALAMAIIGALYDLPAAPSPTPSR